jgi:hypothetical protein
MAVVPMRPSQDELGWVQAQVHHRGSLGINRETNISVDAILLMMYQVHQGLRDVFPVPADLNYAA